MVNLASAAYAKSSIARQNLAIVECLCAFAADAWVLNFEL